MPCTPPFYPTPGHENRGAHDASASCWYYLVCVGYIVGVFTHSWIAREQTEGCSHSHQKAFKTWAEVIAYWDQFCAAVHGPRCPAIIPPPPGFSTAPGASLPPGPPPCTNTGHIYTGHAAAPSPAPSTSGASTTSDASSTSGASSTSASSSTSTSSWTSMSSAATASAAPRAASAPAVAAESTSDCSSVSSMSDTSSLFDSEDDGSDENAPTNTPTNTHTQHTQSEPPTPVPKKEEPRSPSLFTAPPRRPVTLESRVMLSPTGYARAAALTFANAPVAPPNSPSTSRRPLAPLLPAFVPGPLSLSSIACADSRESTASRETTPASTREGTAFPTTPTPMPAASTSALQSLLVTPNPHTPLPAAPATPVPERLYGIRGVSVFYTSHAAARAAARLLGISDPKIMVSDNDAKLEAWMTNRPFVGEES